MYDARRESFTQNNDCKIVHNRIYGAITWKYMYILFCLVLCKNAEEFLSHDIMLDWFDVNGIFAVHMMPLHDVMYCSASQSFKHFASYEMTVNVEY